MKYDEVDPKKSLGQHWLNDSATLDAICDAAEVGPDDTVLEVGPGQGSLTRKLVARARQVIAVEKDEQLYSKLVNEQIAKNLQFVSGDILQFDLTTLPVGYKVVANIPYYLTSNLIRRLCESTNPFSTAALLVQKEVAERVCAGPGDMSLLSISVQFYCDVELGELVPAYLFTPPPKVDSQILVLHYRGPKYPQVDEQAFFRLVKAGFSERRKKLRSSLSGGLHFSKQAAEELLARAGIDSNLRAQELSLEDWHVLYENWNPSVTVKIFVYGTLKDVIIQEKVLNRTPQLFSDRLQDFDIGQVQINGNKYLQALRRPGECIDGMVMSVTLQELQALDEYETNAYQRVEVLLESGTKAWVYAAPENSNT